MNTLEDPDTCRVRCESRDDDDAARAVYEAKFIESIWTACNALPDDDRKLVLAEIERMCKRK